MDFAMSSTIDNVFLITRSQIKQLHRDDIAALILVLLLSIAYSLKGLVWDKPDPYYHLWFTKPQGEEAGSSKKATTRDVALKIQQDDNKVAILWGSQSGTAEGFANRLALECKRRFGLSAVALDLADYDPESISGIPGSVIVIFIISTYGEGDPSDNATNFLSWLERNQTVQFQNLRYAAFGLGNKNYKYYNRVVDIVSAGLDRLQARRLLKVGKADDSNGTTEEDFTEWKDNLFSIFKKQLGFQEKPQQYEPAFRIVEDDSLALIDLHTGQPLHLKAPRRTAVANSDIRPLPVSMARKLFSTKTRQCLHLELDTSEYPELKYKTGDHLAIWPSNPTSEVKRLLTVLGLEDRAQIPLLISSLDPTIRTKVPSPITAEVLFRYYLEICAPVSRQTVLSLAHYAPSPSSREHLINLGENKDAYISYCAGANVNLGRLLEQSIEPGDSWANLPLSMVLESLRPLGPRYYSISSSSIVSPKRISLTVSISLLDSNELPVPGLTTTYLTEIERAQNDSSFNTPTYALDGPENILRNRKLFAHIRRSKFRLPALASTPIIMVASGSGIAPFRGFLLERRRFAAMGRDVGQTVLFFGCRKEDEDYLYNDELKEFKESLGNKMTLVTAFSRQDLNGAGGRMYVQDRVEEHADMLKDLLFDSSAYFYVCGSANMSRGVSQKLGERIRISQGWDDKQLREWSEQIKKSHRWQEDVWG